MSEWNMSYVVKESVEAGYDPLAWRDFDRLRDTVPLGYIVVNLKNQLINFVEHTKGMVKSRMEGGRINIARGSNCLTRLSLWKAMLSTTLHSP